MTPPKLSKWATTFKYTRRVAVTGCAVLFVLLVVVAAVAYRLLSPRDLDEFQRYRGESTSAIAQIGGGPPHDGGVELGSEQGFDSDRAAAAKLVRLAEPTDVEHLQEFSQVRSEIAVCHVLRGFRSRPKDLAALSFCADRLVVQGGAGRTVGDVFQYARLLRSSEIVFERWRFDVSVGFSILGDLPHLRAITLLRCAISDEALADLGKLTRVAHLSVYAFESAQDPLDLTRERVRKLRAGLRPDLRISDHYAHDFRLAAKVE